MRALTAGEIDLLRNVYGETLRYSEMRVRCGGWRTTLTGAIVFGPTIHCNPRCYVDDFARARPGLQALLMHEAMHVWQYQNLPEYHWLKAGAEHALYYGRVYDYDIRAHELLLEYRYEQQGRIVQDYHLLRCAGRDASRHAQVIATALPLQHS